MATVRASTGEQGRELLVQLDAREMEDLVVRGRVRLDITGIGDVTVLVLAGELE